tara:strand:- start:656 stop:1552 length:897 start_codon:yes stop_codon:yes gene_type:complete
MKLSFLFFIILFLVLSSQFIDFFSSLRSSIPFLLGLVMFGMGLTIKIKDFRKIVKKPIFFIVGLGLQFSIMPFLAFFLSTAFGLKEELILGFIILGSCPGGTASNVITYLAGGNVLLSVSLTIFSTLIACILTPFLIYIFGKTYVDIDIMMLFKSTFWIVIFPIFDGIILRHFIDKNKIEKIISYLPKFSEMIIAIIIAIIFALNYENIFLLDIKFFSVVFLHNILGFLIAFHISKKLLFSKDIQRTIAIEVAMQNSGLGVALSLLHFGKLVAFPSAFFSLWHNLSSIFLINYWNYKK